MITLAETFSVDSPRSGSSLLKVELAPSVHHLGVTVALVGVDHVDPRLLYLLHVGVRSKTVDVGIPACYDSNTEGGKRHWVSNGPL